MASGAFTVVNNYLPGSELLDVALLNAVGLFAIALGVVSLRLPWQRWHPRASLVLGRYRLERRLGVDVLGRTKAELYERARRLDVRGRSRMSKNELGQAIARKQD